ncbi:MAG: HEPN domain-containing protein [Desulfobacterales bacterium]|nr:HEPN domain-containing protein [Desulfobacterales bacterium]
MKEEFFSKAEENLKIAQLSFEHDCYNACANRAYYAAFQAAIAALADKGIRSEKNDHAWVQSEFSLRLIKRKKIYPAKLKPYLLDMQFIRNMADYSKENIGKKVARKQLSQATELIRIIEKELTA